MAAACAAPFGPLVAALLLGAACLVSGAEVLGVGGFVRAAPHLEDAAQADAAPRPRDLSAVRVSLMHGAQLRDVTECAPNGYYFFPLEAHDEGKVAAARSPRGPPVPCHCANDARPCNSCNKNASAPRARVMVPRRAPRSHAVPHAVRRAQEYTLRVTKPAGWIFKPASARVVVGEGEGEGDDLNFELTGFNLRGRVAFAPGDGKGGGAAGVNLTVEREGSPGGKYSTAETVLSAADGSYVFSDLAPGRYAITAAHPSWSFAGAGTAHATVTWGEDADAETITVSGFTVSGVVSSGGLWWTQARGPQPLVRALPPPRCGGPREVRWPCSSDSHTAAAADRRARLPFHAGPVQSRLGVHPSADGRGS